MNIETLKKAINKTNSTLFTVRFVKADGTERTMYCKTGVKRHLSKRPDKRVLQNTNPNIVRVFDIESKSYKSFKLETVLEFKCKNVILK